MGYLLFIIIFILGLAAFVWMIDWIFTGGRKIKKEYKRIQREENFNPSREYIRGGVGLAADKNERKLFLGICKWFGLQSKVAVYDMNEVNSWNVSWRTINKNSGSNTYWSLEIDVNDPECPWYKIGFGVNESAAKGWSSYLKNI